jgi:hypothetical protein
MGGQVLASVRRPQQSHKELDFSREESVHADVVGSQEALVPTAKSASPQWRGFGWWEHAQEARLLKWRITQWPKRILSTGRDLMQSSGPSANQMRRKEGRNGKNAGAVSSALAAELSQRPVN